MGHKIEKAFHENIELKYQLYNSLFLTLPLDAVEQTGLLLPLLQKACLTGYENGSSPHEIIDRFFSEHRPGLKEEERISFMFKIIQYVERQIVLIDALEEAAYNKIHHIGSADSWERVSEQVKTHQLENKFKELMSSFGVRVVLTAHPTQFYPGSVLAIVNDLRDSIIDGDIALSRDLLQQLGKTPFYRKEKPTAFDEANSLTWYLDHIFYPAVGELLDGISQNFPELEQQVSKLITMGFWPGGDRDGNPFVTVDTTRKVAQHLRHSIIRQYASDIKELKRRLSFKGIAEKLNQLDDQFQAELSHTDAPPIISLDGLKNVLDEIEQKLKHEHQGLFLDKLKSFKRKVNAFGFFFASIDIRQDSRVIARAFEALTQKVPGIFPKGYAQMTVQEQIKHLFKINHKITLPPLEEEVLNDTITTFKVIREIQQANGKTGSHRFIISNCRGAIDVARVYALARLCGWGDEELSLDVIPLFETIDDLKMAGETMHLLYHNQKYREHVNDRNNTQTVMLGFSDGTKDGGYVMANWSIYRAKEEITAVSRKHDVTVLFFDGRGGPPARGGGNAHLFYSAMGKTIESKQIQMTVQGQTISSHYGIEQAAVHNLGHLLTAGVENNLFNRKTANINDYQRELIEALSKDSFEKYEALKNHPKFIPFLEERSTLKYYGMANIGSRPSKRGADKKLKFEDLRAIPFVGAWSQLKQNVPGYFGIGTALKKQEEQGNLQACIDLYQHSVFFKTLIGNSMQSMSKTNFNITRYMEHDEKFGEFWQTIYQEFQLSKEMVLKVSGYSELLEDNARSRMSIRLREHIVLPLLTIQQYALMQIQKADKSGNHEHIQKYERMVMRSLFGNINASRNSV